MLKKSKIVEERVWEKRQRNISIENGAKEAESWIWAKLESEANKIIEGVDKNTGETKWRSRDDQSCRYRILRKTTQIEDFRAWKDYQRQIKPDKFTNFCSQTERGRLWFGERQELLIEIKSVKTGNINYTPREESIWTWSQVDRGEQEIRSAKLANSVVESWGWKKEKASEAWGFGLGVKKKDYKGNGWA